MIALASASDENKRLLNKIDSKSLLERCLKTTPLSQVCLYAHDRMCHVRPPPTSVHIRPFTYPHP